MTNDSVPINRRELLLTTAGAATLMVMPPGMAVSNADNGVGRSQLFDQGWRFHRGEGQGFEATELNDGDWRAIDLPHDWSIEDLPSRPTDGAPKVIGPFDRDSRGGTATGFTMGGEGWYRKRFHLVKPTGGRVEILFEGIYMNSDVWLNGVHLGAHPNGYTAVAYNLTPHLAASGDNVLAVRVRNLGENSRWYSGSGIYRHVWLDVLPEQARLARWGVSVVTRRIVDAGAELEISTQLEDIGTGLTLVSRVRDGRGRIVKEASASALAQVTQTMIIEKPALWSPSTPSLYTLETELRRGKEVLDRASNQFGIRVVTFDPEQGMAINGQSTKLRGGCIHHDNGLLGAAAFDAAEERKVLLLKARGYNAVRPSHNPFSSAFLSACDRHGMMVIGESFDVWGEKKLPQDYSVYFDQYWRSDMAALILSARNHPSIIMWSIGNEIPGRNSAHGVETQWRLANEVHRLDPSRPVTAAINGFAGRPVTPSERTARAGFAGVPDQASVVFLDAVGYNYKLDDYEGDHRRYPKRVLYGSESFPRDAAAIWALTDKSPWLLGDFVWTAMDYLGEAGIGGSAVVKEQDINNPLALMGQWPYVNAHCGDVDLIGLQKAQSLARDVIWGLSSLEVAVQRPMAEGMRDVPRPWGWPDEQPSWTWPGAESRPLSVRVYTSGDRVELRLNGTVIENKPVTAADLKRAEFIVTYAPGVLEAVAYRDGVQIASKRLATVGPAMAIRVRPERAKGAARRTEVEFVAVEIIDAEGRIVPDASRSIQLSMMGPAELVAFGSASPIAVGSFQSLITQTWNGRALAIVRATGKTGQVRIAVRADGLAAGDATIALS